MAELKIITYDDITRINKEIAEKSRVTIPAYGVKNIRKTVSRDDVLETKCPEFSIFSDKRLAYEKEAVNDQEGVVASYEYDKFSNKLIRRITESYCKGTDIMYRDTSIMEYRYYDCGEGRLYLTQGIVCYSYDMWYECDEKNRVIHLIGEMLNAPDIRYEEFYEYDKNDNPIHIKIKSHETEINYYYEYD